MKPKIAFFIPVLLFAIIGMVPFHAAAFGGMLDGSWARVMHLGFINHWQWGKDIVFTMGPYGFLISDQDARTHILSCEIWLALAVAFSIALVSVANDAFKNRWIGLIWSLVFVVISTASLLGSTDALCSAFVLLLILSKENRQRRMLLPALALISLMKDSAFVDCPVIIGILELDRIVFERPAWIRNSLVLWYAGSLLYFWILAFQNPLNLMAWIQGSIHTVGAYADAMSSTGAAECSDLVIWFVLSFAVLSVIWKSGVYLAKFLAFAFVAFAAFQHGFIRHDGHEMQAMAIMCLIALCGVALCWEEKA